MLIRMIKTEAGPNGCFTSGQKYDLSAEVAQNKIKDGLAVFVRNTALDVVEESADTEAEEKAKAEAEEKAKQEAEIETASKAAPENAMKENYKNKAKK